MIGIVIVYGKDPVEANQLNAAAQNTRSGKLTFNSLLVVVPTDPVPKGTKLTQVKLETTPWPRSDVPLGAVQTLDEIGEMYAKVELPARQPIVKANLSSTPLLGGILELIPPGHRAIAIDVDATTGVEGWAFPGAHVDVLVTYRDAEDGISKTRIAVDDAVVMSFDGSTERETANDMGSRISSTSTVTLAVPPDDTLKIRTAQAIGKISLVLRNSNDIKSPGTRTFGANEWESSQKKERKEFAPKGFARYTDQNGNSVELTLGSDSKWFSSGSAEDY